MTDFTEADFYGNKIWQNCNIKEMTTNEIVNAIKSIHDNKGSHIELEAELGRRIALTVLQYSFFKGSIED